MNIEILLKNPPKEYAIYPIIHDGIAHPEWILEQAEKRGYAGAVVNLHYTKGFPYDEAEWDAFKKGCEALTERGLKFWIYDEKGYPSATAGGTVLDRHPEYEIRGWFAMTIGKH